MDKDIPKAAFITQFHALMLFKDRVKEGVCLLNKQSVFDVVMMVPMVDCLSWHITRSRTYTGHSMSVQVVNETRYVWRVYLEKGQFNLAIRHTGGQQQAAMDLILTKQVAEQ